MGAINEVPQGDYWILKTDNRQSFVKYVLSLDLSEPIAAEIKPKVEPRTKRQNKYIWGWVYKNIVIGLEESGQVITGDDEREHPYTQEIIHLILREKYLIEDVIQTRSRSGAPLEYKIYKSTAKLSKKEFAIYINQCKEFAYMVWGVSVPETTRGYWYEFYRDLVE